MVMDHLEKFLSKQSCKAYLIAVSGGIDSMVLLTACLAYQEKHPDCTFELVHINHQLRPESDLEEKELRDLCKAKGILGHFYRWDRGPAISSGIEEEARNFRYQTFLDLMEERDLEMVLTAHHGQDQVETLLMRLVRGTGARGLVGIPASRPLGTRAIGRPFLGLSKEDLHVFALANQVVYWEDSSNRDEAYTRNRYRHQVVPLLKEENPRLETAIYQLTQEMTAIQEVMELLIQSWQDTHLEKRAEGWASLSSWTSLSKAELHLLLGHLLQEIGIDNPMRQLETCLTLLGTSVGNASLDLGKSWVLRRSYGNWSLIKEAETLPKVEDLLWSSPEQKTLAIGSRTSLIIEEQARPGAFTFQVSPNDFPLTVRPWQAGDRVLLNAQPPQHQKLSRWMINQKIPRPERDKILVVESARKEILAILPYRQGARLLNPNETDKITMNYITF